MASHPAIRPAAFIRYKFLNSLFLGLSVGAVFVLYTPLSPAVFSAGGLGLALGTLIVATQYRRILVPVWFFRLSLLVELITLSGVAAVLILPIELTVRAVRLHRLPNYLLSRELSGALRDATDGCCRSAAATGHRKTRQAIYLAWQWHGRSIPAWNTWPVTEEKRKVVSLHWLLLGVEVDGVLRAYGKRSTKIVSLMPPACK